MVEMKTLGMGTLKARFASVTNIPPLCQVFYIYRLNLHSVLTGWYIGSFFKMKKLRLREVK